MSHSPHSRYRRARRAVVALVPLLYFATLCRPPAFAQSAPVTYQVIARTGDPAPGTGPGVTFAPGVNFNTFGSPGIGPAGEVVFGGFLAGAGVNASNDSALFSGPGGAISLLARSGAPAPDTTANYGRLWQYGFEPLPIKAGGRVVFTAPLTDGFGADGLFLGTPGAVTLVGRSGQQAPDTEPGVRFESSFAFVGTLRHFALNDAGQVAFNVVLTGPGDLSSGLFAGAPGSLRIAARTGTPAPGTGGDTFAQWSRPAINASGAVALTGWLTQTRDEGIWLGQPGALELAVRTGMPAPGTAGTFNGLSFFEAPNFTSLNNANQIAFLARESDNDTQSTGIWAGPPGSFQLVALTGRPAPGAGGNFEQFLLSPPAINDRGEVAFEATAPARTNGHGIWAGRPGALDLIAIEGGSAPLGPGSPSARFSQFGPLILNDAGQVAFQAFLESDDQSFSGWSYWVTDPSGELRLIAREGGLLDLGGDHFLTVARLSDARQWDPGFMSLGTESGQGFLFFNDAGQMVFRAQLGDGTQAIIVATVPEPAGVAFVGSLAALCLLRPQRRANGPSRRPASGR